MLMLKIVIFMIMSIIISTSSPSIIERFAFEYILFYPKIYETKVLEIEYSTFIKYGNICFVNTLTILLFYIMFLL